MAKYPSHRWPHNMMVPRALVGTKLKPPASKTICCCCSVAKLCLTLCDPVDCSMPGFHCPSPSPRVCSYSCPLSWWCHPAVSSSVIPFSSCLQYFPAWGSFPMSWHFTSGGQSIGVSVQHQFFQWIFRVDFLQDWLLWCLCCPRDSQESSPAAQFESIILQHSSFLMVQLSYLYVTTGKTCSFWLDSFD